MRVDEFSYLADNKTNKRYGEQLVVLTGVLEHGEFNMVTHGIPVRSHKFSSEYLLYKGHSSRDNKDDL